MIKNFFKVALRNMMKRKAYTLINILGLATGMAVCLLIVLFVQSELNYDKQHEKAKDIYRLVLDRIYPGRRTAIQHDKELKAFYERRLATGKSKNSTINIVRNKLILRMFAVINHQTPFVQHYSKVV